MARATSDERYAAAAACGRQWFHGRNTADQPVYDSRRGMEYDGARCDACHARRSHVQRSQDGLVTVCGRCARGVDLGTSDADEAIAAVARRAPAAERP